MVALFLFQWLYLVGIAQAMELKRGIVIDRQFWQIPVEPYNTVVPADVALIKCMGFDFVKVVINPDLFIASYEQNAKNLNVGNLWYVDTLVNQFVSQGMHVVVCIHPEASFKNLYLGSEGGFVTLQSFYKYFAEYLASKWTPDQVAFQLMTEPFGNYADWNLHLKALVTSVRTTMPAHTLILSGAQVGNIAGFIQVDPDLINDPNVIYGFSYWLESNVGAFVFQGFTAWGGYYPYIRNLPYPSYGTNNPYDYIAANTPGGQVNNAIGAINAYRNMPWDMAMQRAVIEPINAWNRSHGGKLKIMCYEMGAPVDAVVGGTTADADRNRYIRDKRMAMEESNISWAYWSYNETFSCLGSTRVPLTKTPTLSMIDQKILCALGLPITLPVVKADGLLLHWGFDETSGSTIKDLTDNHFDGSITGTGIDYSWVPGIRNGAVNLTPSCSVTTNFQSVVGIALDSFSIAFWIKPNNHVDWNQQIGLGWAEQFQFHTTATGAVYVGITKEVGDRLTAAELPANTLELNTWQHFCFTFNKGNATLYKNGILLASKQLLSKSIILKGFSIQAAEGFFDDMRIYSRDLSAVEARQLYVGATPPTITPIADQDIPSNGTGGPINFTVGDAETAVTALTVQVSSNNPGLIPAANIVLQGNGANRTVTITPATNTTGAAKVTLVVIDGDGGQASTVFNVFVKGYSIQDVNGDGISDIWAALYPTAGAPSADLDGDGQSNLAEARAGTDPTNPASRLIATAARDASGNLVVRWPGIAGKYYFIETSTDLATWTPLPGDYTGTGAELSAIVRPAGTGSGSRAFWHVVVFDMDSTGSGLNDWEKLQLNKVATITSTAGVNGSISPAGKSYIAKGSSLTFALTPATGFVVDQVQVDGQNVGAVSTYRFPSITTDHTISATFKSTATLTVAPVSLSLPAAASTGSATVSAGGTWTASSDSNWLTVSPAGGSGNGTLAFSATANTSVVRSATVSVQSGALSQQVSITQARGPAYYFKNRWTGVYMYDSGDHLGYGTANAADTYKWTIEDVGNGQSEIRNVGTGDYIHIQALADWAQCGTRTSGSTSSRWTFENAGGGFIRFKNVGNPDRYLHAQDQKGYVQEGPTDSTYWSAQWTQETAP